MAASSDQSATAGNDPHQTSHWILFAACLALAVLLMGCTDSYRFVISCDIEENQFPGAVQQTVTVCQVTGGSHPNNYGLPTEKMFCAKPPRDCYADFTAQANCNKYDAVIVSNPGDATRHHVFLDCQKVLS